MNFNKTYKENERPTLREELPSSFSNAEFPKSAVIKHLDVRVIEQVDGTERAWPGQHKNVHVWWRLENGRVVGFNENPSRGWSFPVKMDRPPSE